jgi:hypothetical protein
VILIAILVWLVWFAVTLLLTFAGLLVVAGAGFVYTIGWGIDKAKPGKGQSTMAVGRVVFALTVEVVDRMNGHRKPARPQPAVLVHTVQEVHAPVQSPPARPEPPQRPVPSKAQQIAEAPAAYVTADLLDDADSVDLLEERLGAIVGVGEKTGSSRA